MAKKQRDKEEPGSSPLYPSGVHPHHRAAFCPTTSQQLYKLGNRSLGRSLSGPSKTQTTAELKYHIQGFRTSQDSEWRAKASDDPTFSKQKQFLAFKKIPSMVHEYIFILCVWAFCLHVCLYIMCVPGATRGQKRVSDPQELKLQMLLSCYVSARNQTQVLCEIIQCF